MAKKPGFYTGTLIYAVAMFAILLFLCVATRSNVEMRKKVGFFTLVLTIGTALIMTHIALRIKEAEAAAHGMADPNKIHDVGLCPDAYIIDEETGACRPNRSTLMTIGPETKELGEGTSSIAYKIHAGGNLEKVDENAKLNIAGIRDICASSRMNHSYAEFRPLCGE